MNYLETLIDKASAICGGQNALAKQLGFSSGTLSDMKHGRKAISPATAIELADICNEDVNLAISESIYASVEGTRREVKIREILGKALVAGVVGMSVFSYSSDSMAKNSNDINSLQSIHRINLTGRLVRRGIKRVLTDLIRGFSPYQVLQKA